MRLIDADSVIEFYKKQAKDGGFYAPIYEGVCNIIGRFPTIDAVPVVRCKNCKHFNLQTHECENESLSTDHEGGASYSLNFYDDDFCSYGKWREAAHEVSEP